MAKKSKRKEASIKSSILVLLLILILLISSTYAWFTANKKVTVSSLNVNVEAKNGLQISTDAKTWKTVITNEDITSAAYAPDGEANANQLPNQLSPVSTAKGVTGGQLDFFLGSLEANEKKGGAFELSATTEPKETKGTSGNFIAFDLYFKVTTPIQLNLEQTSDVVEITEAGQAGTALEKNGGLPSASRIALVNEGNLADGNTDTKQYTNMMNGNAGTTIIWEPNNDLHKPEAIVNARDSLGVASPQGEQPTYGVAAEIAKEKAIAANQTQQSTPGTLTEVTNDIKSASTGLGSDIALTNLNLQAGITKVRVYMWIEGQDIDCENSASGSNVRFDLKFNIA